MSVVVVGGGPAGMNAAVRTARAGAEVVLVDSAEQLGGQFHRQLPAQFAAQRPDRVQHDWQRFLALRDEILAHPRIRYLPRSTVWALEPDQLVLHVQSGSADALDRRSSVLRADALVLATGAHDRVLPFPGWDLPGVFSAGAAQAMAKGQRIAVGRRVLVAGTGPFLLPVAESLLDVGAEVVGVLEAGNPAAWLRQSTAIAGQFGKLAELAGYAARFAGRVPYRIRTTVVEARGDDRVRTVVTAKVDSAWRPIPGTQRRIEVDAVCVGHGFVPQLELALAARCRVVDGFVEVDAAQRTSTPGVFAAGETTGIGGAQLAAAEGAVAGLAAAVHAGVTNWNTVEAQAREALVNVRSGREFARALARSHPIGSGWSEWLKPDTLVCRCEEVPYRALKDAVLQRTAHSARSLKLLCRVGLGPCQGRICGRNATDLAEQLLGEPLPDPETPARRPIATPIRLADLASIPTSNEEEK
ncbi:FAD-dependent oxidoreductase [Saccharopolyspora sp. K220]|uniref:FAD-dependent oxidoreductase n=1 Tax=Saccharopolyspora soli TaxID=2926618 RepID=UPI001F56D798|nr:FAD-dependent oxidoreductase [Saccharopolyspora soli]MCI2422715.1 FAD-dependent oxidoreductase [Saccharopolyspora soli]